MFNLIINKDLDKYLAVIGMFTQIIFLCILKYFNYGYNYIIVAVLSFLFLALWLVLRSNASITNDIPPPVTSARLIESMQFILIFILIYIFYSRPDLYERPLDYFIAMSIFCCILFIDIAMYRNTRFVLILLIIFGSISAWSQNLIFPSLVGVDPWWHQSFTYDLIATCHIPTDTSYSNLPLFHLIIAQLAVLTNIDYKQSALLSISLSQVICNVLFAFLLARYIFDNYKVGLLASLALVIGNYHILMSIWPIPNSFGDTFILPIIYLLFRFRSINHKNNSSTVCIYLFMISLILTHSLAALGFAIILFSMCFSGFLFKIIYSNDANSNVVTFRLSMGYLIAMLVWWSFASNTTYMLQESIRFGLSMDKSIYVPQYVYSAFNASISQLEKLLVMLGFELFFSFAIMGLLYMISSKGNRFSFITAVAGFNVLCLGFIPFMVGYTTIEERWWYLAQILLSISFGAAMYILLSIKKFGTFRLILMSSFILMITFLMIVSPAANIDNHLLSPKLNVRLALIESELQAGNKLYDISSGIKTDTFYASRLDYLLGSKQFDISNSTNYLKIYKNYDISDYLKEEHFNNSDVSLIVIRDYIIRDTFWLYNYKYKINYDPRKLLLNEGYSKIYENNHVTGWLYP